MPLLSSSDLTDLERQLLRSWESERPSPAARENTLAMLGLASVTAAGAGGAAAVGSSIAPKAIAAGWVVMAKWTAVGVVAISAATGAYALTRHRSVDDSATSTLAPAQTITTPVRTAETQQTVIELPGPTTTHTLARSPSPASSSLTQQVAAVDRARAALDGGEPTRARHLVDAYEAEYPTGAFLQEVEVIRTDAFVREGNRAEAERVGKRFLSTYPKSPHAVRVRALLGYDP